MYSGPSGNWVKGSSRWRGRRAAYRGMITRPSQAATLASRMHTDSSWYGKFIDRASVRSFFEHVLILRLDQYLVFRVGADIAGNKRANRSNLFVLVVNL